VQGQLPKLLGATVLIAAIQGTALGYRGGPPDSTGLREIETRLIAAVETVRPATVAVRSGRNRNSFATGVLVGEDLVLTAGHVGRKSGRPVTITLSDGRVFRGITLGQRYEHNVDVGLIRLQTKDDNLPFLDLWASDPLETGDWVIMLGHAAMMRTSDRDHPIPAVRAGRVLRVSGPRLEVDAPFDSGDSGGPVVDLDGNLVGIVSRCGFHPWQNTATHIDTIRRFFPDLLENGDEIEINEQRPEQRSARSAEGSKRDPALHEALAPFIWSISPSIVRIMEEDRHVCSGTVVGDGLVITKASTLARQANNPQVFGPNDERGLPARVIGVDPTLDVVLLKVDGLDAPPVSWGTPEKTSAGRFLIVPDANGHVRSIGVIARDEDSSTRHATDRPFVGISFREQEDPPGLRITTVTPSAPAEIAGVRVGDVLRAIDGAPMSDRSSLRRTLANKHIGDSILLALIRGDQDLEVPLSLGLRPSTELRSLPTNTATATSRLSTGYGRMFLCDAVLEPNEVGVPVVDLAGEVVGLAMARRSRTATVVVPSDRVLESFEQLLAQEPLPAASLAVHLAGYRTLHTVDGDGVLRLDAEEAFPRGDAIRRERRDDGRTTWGHWTDKDDHLEWTALVESPGRFAVSMVHSCTSRNRGTPIRCWVGGEYVDAHVESTGKRGEFDVQDLGVVEIAEPGEVQIRLEPLGTPRSTVTLLARVTLTLVHDEESIE
jgi:serine protease Do